MSLAQLKTDIKAVFNDLTGKTANVKGDEVATAIWGNPNTWNSGAVKECGDADYSILDGDGYDTFIFRDISANRSLNYPTLLANLGRKIKAILVSTTETLTLDVAPATDWAAANVVTGQTSAATCVVVAKLTALTYKVKSRSGVYTLGEIIGVTGVAAKLADQGATKPTLAHDSYKITQVHEVNGGVHDKMNGYASDIDITEWGGWWELTGTATEWRGITDGNSTIYQTESNATINLTNTSSIWEDVITIANVPPGIYILESNIEHYHLSTNVVDYISLYAGIGVTTGDVTPSIVTETAYLTTAGDYIDGFFASQKPSKNKHSLEATTTLRLKTKYVSDEAATTHQAFALNTTEITYIRARRVA